MRKRVHQLAKELGLSSKTLMEHLAAVGHPVLSASNTLPNAAVTAVKKFLGEPSLARPVVGQTVRQTTWNTGAVRASAHPDTVRELANLKHSFKVAADHESVLSALGSQFVHVSSCKLPGFEDCYIALVRFSGAIESAFGLTREVLFFYSPYRDLQIRTYKAARRILEEFPREVSPDMLFLWSPDLRLREKLDDWSSGNFLAVPLQVADEDGPIGFISLLRDYIYSRDLFYETTPVKDDRFFGRRGLLQGLREDVRNQRVSGLFGLRKAGKTSVLSELSSNLSDENTLVILRDLESLPSPPNDPVPDLLKDLLADLLDELRTRRLGTQALVNLGDSFDVPEFKRAMQATLRRLSKADISIVIMFDEIEYITPADRIDIHEGELASVAQLLSALRSLVQENDNFTFLLSGLTSSIVESGRLYGRPNPLFSWAKAHFLRPFERYEADDLAVSVSRKMGISIDDNALAALFDATGGHAFLYRHLASHIVQMLPVDVIHRQIKGPDVLRGLADWRLLVAGNLKEMIDHVKRYYPDEAFLLEVLKDEDDSFDSFAEDAPLAVGHLVNLGLIQRVDNHFELTPVLDLL